MSERGLACPGCGESMVEITVRDAKLDRCRGCFGLWFDVGEFAYTAGCQVPPLQVHDASVRECPCCKESLKLAKLGPAVVDWCDACRGLYLDTGEFDVVRKGRPPLPADARDSAMPTEPPCPKLVEGIAGDVILGILVGAIGA